MVRFGTFFQSANEILWNASCDKNKFKKSKTKFIYWRKKLVLCYWSAHSRWPLWLAFFRSLVRNGTVGITWSWKNPIWNGTRLLTSWVITLEKRPPWLATAEKLGKIWCNLILQHVECKRNRKVVGCQLSEFDIFFVSLFIDIRNLFVLFYDQANISCK